MMQHTTEHSRAPALCVEPLVPSEVDVSVFPWAPVRLGHIASHRLVLLPDPEPFRAMMLLCAEAWTQKPAMSLPNDDARLAAMAGFGRDVQAWAKIREVVMLDWVLANDDRWYQPEFANWALQAWANKQSAAQFSEKQRQRAKSRAAPERLPSPMHPTHALESSRGSAVAVPMKKLGPTASEPLVTGGKAAAQPFKESQKKSNSQMDKDTKIEERDCTGESSASCEAHGDGSSPLSFGDVHLKKSSSLVLCADSANGTEGNQVVQVFDYWRIKTGRPVEPLDDARRKCIQSCLDSGLSVELICKAIDGASTDDFYQGRTAKNSGRSDTLDIICKNRDRVIRLASLVDQRGPLAHGLSPAAEKTARTFLELLEEDNCAISSERGISNSGGGVK